MLGLLFTSLPLLLLLLLLAVLSVFKSLPMPVMLPVGLPTSGPALMDVLPLAAALRPSLLRLTSTTAAVVLDAGLLSAPASGCGVLSSSHTTSAGDGDGGVS